MTAPTDLLAVLREAHEHLLISDGECPRCGPDVSVGWKMPARPICTECGFQPKHTWVEVAESLAALAALAPQSRTEYAVRDKDGQLYMAFCGDEAAVRKYVQRINAMTPPLLYAPFRAVQRTTIVIDHPLEDA